MTRPAQDQATQAALHALSCATSDLRMGIRALEAIPEAAALLEAARAADAIVSGLWVTAGRRLEPPAAEVPL